MDTPEVGGGVVTGSGPSYSLFNCTLLALSVEYSGASDSGSRDSKTQRITHPTPGDITPQSVITPKNFDGEFRLALSQGRRSSNTCWALQSDKVGGRKGIVRRRILSSVEMRLF